VPFSVLHGGLALRFLWSVFHATSIDPRASVLKLRRRFRMHGLVGGHHTSHGFSKALVHGNTAIGTQFVWSTGGMDIHSTIQRVDPGKAICWTGRMFHIHAIHCWTLSSLPDDKVLVKTRESMDGWLISRIYSSPELLKSDQRWLAQLKQAAEH
jgi:hypothetical protein